MNVVELVTIFAAEEETASESGAAVLGIDPVAIALQATTFLILFFIIRKFALSKIIDGLNERRQTIEKSLDEAEELHKRNQQSQQAADQSLAEARSEANKIINDARTEAGAMLKQSEIDTAARTEKMLADAESNIEAQIAGAKKDLKSEMFELISQASETVIGEKLDKSKDAALLTKALKELN